MDYCLFEKRQSEIQPDLKLLDTHETIRYQRLIYPQKQLEFVTGRTFLKQVLASYLGISAHSIFLSLTPSGKPYLSAVYGNQRPCFNLSHANGYYLMGLSTDPIGVDIEENRQVNLTHFKHFLTPNEHRILSALSETARMDPFYQLFTAKEAFLKATDKRWQIDDLAFSRYRDQWVLQNPVERCQFFQTRKDNYWMTVCLQRPN